MAGVVIQGVVAESEVVIVRRVQQVALTDTAPPHSDLGLWNVHYFGISLAEVRRVRSRIDRDVKRGLSLNRG